jgi:uncharacterized protein DUF4245
VSEQRTGRPRGFETAGDMVRSLAVVLVLVAVVIFLTVRPHPRSTVHRIDYTEALAQARDQASYDVLAPTGLSRAWRATSARTDRDDSAVTWHLGFVTPHDDYAAVEQGDGDPESFVASFAEHGKRAGRVDVGGAVWRRVDGGDPERHALVLEGDAVTTVVAGGASWQELRTLAAALHAG